jgi:hypothetical protein
MPDPVREKVEALAEAERRSVAQMCFVLVEEALAAREEKNKG